MASVNSSHNHSKFIVQPGGHLSGDIKVPGDKSVSHRSIMLGSLADGDVEVTGFLEGDDALATLNAFRAMGVNIEGPDNGRVLIHGVGMRGLKAAGENLDLGNSGTSMRLLTGLMSGQLFDSVLTGDSSLSTRPMRRVTDPVTSMGANISSCDDGTAPLKIYGRELVTLCRWPVHKLNPVYYLQVFMRKEKPVSLSQPRRVIIRSVCYKEWDMLCMLMDLPYVLRVVES